MVTQMRTPEVGETIPHLSSAEATRLGNCYSQLNKVRICREHLAELKAFMNGVKYAGKPLPVGLSDRTFEHLEFLLEWDRGRLDKEAKTVIADAG